MLCAVVLACDAAHLGGLGSAIGSVVAATENVSSLEFTVVTPGDQVRAASAVAAQCRARTRIVPLEATKLAHLPVPSYGEFGSSKIDTYGNLSSLLNYARFFLPDLVDTEYALYVDVDVVVRCDTVALMASMPALFEAHPHALVAVVERSSHGRRLFNRGYSFNAGVFAAHLGRWRAVGATPQLEAIMRRNAEALRNRTQQLWSRPSSQAPMTRVFDADRAAPLGSEWNRLFRPHGPPPSDVADLLVNGTTLRYDCAWHFTGAIKPWDYLPLNATRWTLDLWRPYATTPCGPAAGDDLPKWPLSLPSRDDWHHTLKLQAKARLAAAKKEEAERREADAADLKRRNAELKAAAAREKDRLRREKAAAQLRKSQQDEVKRARRAAKRARREARRAKRLGLNTPPP
ncbi:hypothetical protein CTAYLR_001633 [Chrysophaeum taylorii]|uniref:Hexosyltransferase n=1 Tax=Chrysophaeum taylorii TaxID=2483200 RepID=A0AAD7XN95_9STRA|nr:hypothetical protein CTAYLR_001633 [Chrysophaeum taylorii]